MSKPKIFTASIASNSKVKVYNAQTGSLHRIVQLPGGSEIQSECLADPEVNFETNQDC